MSTPPDAAGGPSSARHVTADDVARRLRDATRQTVEEVTPGIVVRAASEGTTRGGMANPMRAAGDLIRGGTSGAPARVGIGAAGDVLTVVAGQPGWAAATGASGRYRSPVYSTYGGGSLLYTADGHLIYALLEVEV